MWCIKYSIKILVYIRTYIPIIPLDILHCKHYASLSIVVPLVLLDAYYISVNCDLYSILMCEPWLPYSHLHSTVCKVFLKIEYMTKPYDHMTLLCAYYEVCGGLMRHA